ncbi:ATP synthase F1 subunit delta [Lacticaseibacillus brantae]|uniref:ATP synthase subunit delta n=1 Tax=Lacticaseibacillus brantae DSM 23927 TaxID=1423727 RepID=A0A0R2B0S9_9LACO|nr:ATP synthase F1 subunit delta [Lacticaseibacillus brantae]KRM72944.1 ATP synthase subunit D [Lacticaseibacillus brantae DSM 23927]
MALTNRDVAPRYGRSTFEVAQSQQGEQQTFDELAQVQSVLADNPQLLQVLEAANVSPEDKQKLLDNVKQALSPLVSNLIQMLFDYGRIGALPLVITDYNARFKAAQGIIDATVTTAVTLSDAQVESLGQAIATRFGGKTAQLQQIVDPTVLGGVKIMSQNQIIDGTVSTKLKKLSAALLAE